MKDVQMIDVATFRHVLGHYPTGVCVVTTADADGFKTGMVVGSFSSVSLDPPLIGFFPDKRSSTWPHIERSGKFCVNILASNQNDVCHRFAASGGDKFGTLDHSVSGNGSPVLRDVAAWIDCTLYRTCDAGDHLLALGLVQDLEHNDGAEPMIFWKRDYGGFAARGA